MQFDEVIARINSLSDEHSKEIARLEDEESVYTIMLDQLEKDLSVAASEMDFLKYKQAKKDIQETRDKKDFCEVQLSKLRASHRVPDESMKEALISAFNQEQEAALDAFIEAVGGTQRLRDILTDIERKQAQAKRALLLFDDPETDRLNTNYKNVLTQILGGKNE